MKSTLFTTDDNGYEYSNHSIPSKSIDEYKHHLSMNMCVKVYNNLNALPEYYAAFFKDIETKDFFSSREWFENIINTTLAPNTELFLYGVETDDPTPSPQALLVTTKAAQNRNGTKIKGWWLHDSSIAGLTNYQCHSHTFLYPSNINNLTEITAALATHLKKERRPIIDLNLFPKGSDCLNTISNQFKAVGMSPSIYEYCSNWIEDTNHLSFEKYLANRSKSTRKGILRKKRRLEENHEVKIEILSNENDSAKAIELFNAVYDTSWKEPEYFQDFTPGLIETCAKKGTLRLGVLYIDGEAASVELCMTANEKTTFAKSAYNPKFSDSSASSILLLHMIEQAVETEKSKLLSFGLFDDTYKKSWCKERRLIEGIVIFNTSTLWGCIGLISYKLKHFKDVQLENIKPYIKALLNKFSKTDSK